VFHKNSEALQLTIGEERLTATHMPAVAEQVAKRKQEFNVQVRFYKTKD
jgi:hypothetical protein